jgi:AP-1 complex subunit mu
MKIKPLIWVKLNVEKHSESRITYFVQVKAQFKEKSTATNVQIYVPVPKDIDTPVYKKTIGGVAYDVETNSIVWTIGQFQGQKGYTLTAQVSLPSIRDPDDELKQKKKPIIVKFEIPYYTVSGLQVRYLKISEDSGYEALPWVRYFTRSGDYQIRQ